MPPVTEEIKSAFFTGLPEPYRCPFVWEAFDLAFEFLRAQEECLLPAELRHTHSSTLARFVRELTSADCVFVRRLNNDGSLELVGEPQWYARDPVGRPPRIKRPGEGISGWVLQQPDSRPIVIKDVFDQALPDAIHAAHGIGRENWCDDSPESQFVRFIRAEACVPLVVNGRRVGAIVAVHGGPYTDEQHARLEKILTQWQSSLIFLYWSGQLAEEFERQQLRLKELAQELPTIAATDNPADFMRMLATVLTCERGLGWHRAMLFRFPHGYPGDAECSIALGGLGNPEWSDQQDQLIHENPDLKTYLQRCRAESFAQNDPLFGLVASGSHAASWSIPLNILLSNDTIRHALCPKRFDSEDTFATHGAIPISNDEAWHSWLKRLALPPFDQVFNRCHPNTERWLIPLVALTSHAQPKTTTLGFLLLDNPYTFRGEIANRLPFTRLICNLFSALLALRMPPQPLPERPVDDGPPLSPLTRHEYDRLLALGASDDTVKQLQSALADIPEEFRQRAQHVMSIRDPAVQTIVADLCGILSES